MAQNQHEGERIAKVIARAGLCSRREAEAWIAVAQGAVAGARDQGTATHDDGTNRNLPGSLSAARLGKRVIHERLWHKTLWRRINTKASASPR